MNSERSGGGTYRIEDRTGAVFEETYPVQWMAENAAEEFDEAYPEAAPHKVDMDTEQCDGICDKGEIPISDLITVPTSGNSPTKYLCDDCYNRYFTSGTGRTDKEANRT